MFESENIYVIELLKFVLGVICNTLLCPSIVLFLRGTAANLVEFGEHLLIIFNKSSSIFRNNPTFNLEFLFFHRAVDECSRSTCGPQSRGWEPLYYGVWVFYHITLLDNAEVLKIAMLYLQLSWHLVFSPQERHPKI